MVDGENALVFATDVELSETAPNRDFYSLMSKPYPAGLAVIDGFFADSEGDFRKDWGHSSWQQARDAGLRAGVETVIVTHHSPRRTDAELASLEQASDGLPWAREGDVWTLRGNHAERD